MIGELQKHHPELRGVAELRRLLRHWERDIEVEQRGGTIHYAVDTSVVHLFVATDRDKPPMYFIDTPEERDSFMTALAHFIFYRMNGDRPLIVIPPHDAEMAGILESMAGEVRMSTKAELATLHKILDHSKFDAQKMTEALLQMAPAVVHLLMENGLGGTRPELERFRQLFHDGRIRVLSPSSPSLLPIGVTQDLDDLEASAGEWFERLSDIKKDASKIMILRDAKVMAKLQWIQRSLGENDEIRLIAFDESLALAWDKLESPYLYNPIRDPRYFMTAPGFQDEKSRADITGWIDEVLVALCPKDIDYEPWLAQLSNQRVRQEKPIKDSRLSKLNSKLATYATELSLHYSLPGESPKKMPSPMEGLALLEYIQINRDTIHDILETKIANTVREIDRLAVQAGFYMLADDDDTLQVKLKSLAKADRRLSEVSRAPAWFRFQGIKEWSRKLLDALMSHEGSFSEVAGAFAWPSSDMQKQYEIRIVHAFILSLDGHWEAAQQMCRRAKAIAEHAPPRDGGLEAGYFHAVCLRHVAKDNQVLDAAAQELDQTEARWLENNHSSDPRFSVERLVQQFLRWEMRHSDVLAGQASPLDDAAIAPNLSDLIQKFWALRSEVYGEIDSEIRVLAVEQLLTNISEAISIEAIILKMPHSSIPFQTLLEEWKKLQYMRGDAIETRPRFVRIMEGIVRWLANSDDTVRRQVLEQIKLYRPQVLGGYEAGLFRTFEHRLQEDA